MSSGTFPLDNVTFNGKCEQIDEKPIGGSTTHWVGSPRAKKNDLQSPERIFGCIFGMENVDDISIPKLWTKFQSKKNWTKFLSKIFGTKIRSEILNEKRQSKNQSKICPKFFSSKSFCFFFWTDFGRSFGRLKKKSRNKFWTARKQKLDGVLGRTLGLQIGRVLASNFENVFVFGILQRRSENFG